MRQETMPGRTAAEPIRVRRYRRQFWLAAGAAVAVHALLLWLVVLPSPEGARPETTLVVLPQPALVEAGPRRRAALAETAGAERRERERARPSPTPTVAIPSVPVPTLAAGAPEAETIPETTLTELRAPILPLVATPLGIGRRTIARDEARIARMRAESLVNARIASVVETRPAPSAGPVSLANGGVTLAIPWGGFVPENREDEAWRAERCRGEEKDKPDKPGEAQARRSQCS